MDQLTYSVPGVSCSHCQHAIEGVYDVRAGDNLGWSEMELAR